MKLISLLTIYAMLLVQVAFAQNEAKYKFLNPASDTSFILEGQAWPNEVKSRFDRLPARAEKLVRSPVWSLSQNSAGIYLRFMSDAEEIIVRYKVSGGLQLPHMPATGVSGVDLYTNERNGNWLWCAGRFSFGDTIVYRFTNLKRLDAAGRIFVLYLPLYNSVKWLEIGVPEQNSLKALPRESKKPIVVYGTSIAQGACATRPGLAWTAILSRKLNRPVINLAFSGNGRLEKELIDLLSELDVSLYVLDCLPNLTGSSFPREELQKRITESVFTLQKLKPGVPILLTEHAGFTDEAMNEGKQKDYQFVNTVLEETFKQFNAEHKRNLYMLTKQEIGLDIESTVDGIHPNDIGMMRYADAYLKKIKKIMK